MVHGAVVGYANLLLMHVCLQRITRQNPGAEGHVELLPTGQPSTSAPSLQQQRAGVSQPSSGTAAAAVAAAAVAAAIAALGESKKGTPDAGGRKRPASEADNTQQQRTAAAAGMGGSSCAADAAGAEGLLWSASKRASPYSRGCSRTPASTPGLDSDAMQSESETEAEQEDAAAQCAAAGDTAGVLASGVFRRAGARAQARKGVQRCSKAAVNCKPQRAPAF
jgi:hypothetical protein